MILTFLTRRDNKTIEICGTNIRKTYRGLDGIATVQRLSSVYERLRSKGVPNVDDMELSHRREDKYSRNITAVVYLKPKGMAVKPKTIKQVFDALSCILEALVVSRPDARVENVLITPYRR